MQPEPFDLLTTSAARVRLAHAVSQEVAPGDPVWPLEALRLEVLHVPAWTRYHQWAVFDGDVMTGWAGMRLDYRKDNAHLAKARIEVDVRHRRRGIGGQLLAAVTDAARADGRRLLGIVAVQGTAGEPFLAAHGAENGQVFRVSRMQTSELDADLMREWVRRAKEQAPGYSLVGWDDPCPEEHLDAFSEVVDVMNTAPLDDLDQEDEHYSPDEIRDMQQCLARRGHAGWVFAARDDSSGRFVGFTEMGFWPWAPELGYQGDTGVHPDHRDRGLGRWLKAAMVLRVLDERPAVRAVETGNAGSNRPMLAINEAMGFRPHRIGGFWQLEI